MSPVSVRVGGAWKTASAVYTRVGGVWKTASDMPVRVGGVWKTGILQAPSDFELIQTITVGSGGASSVTFSSIPSTYKHLQIRGIGGTSYGTTGSADMGLFFNGDSSNSTSYFNHRLFGTGSSAASDATSGSATYIPAIRVSLNTDAANGIFGATIIDILDYTSTSKNKTVRTLTGIDSNGAGLIMLNSGAKANTAAITSITLVDGYGNASWRQYTSFSLYGYRG